MKANPTARYSLVPDTPEEAKRFYDEVDADEKAKAAYAAGDNVAAERYANQAIELGGYSGEEGLLGRILIAEGNYAQAIAPLNVQCNDNQSEEPHDLLPYAYALLKTGQYDRAVAEYNAALPMISLGDLLEERGKFGYDRTKAPDLETCIHIGLGLTDYCERSGNTAQEYRRMLSEYSWALALEPNSPLANLYYGIGLKITGRTAEANAVLKKTAAMASGNIRGAALHPIY